MIPSYLRDYFDWLVDFIDDPGIRGSYEEIKWYLFEREFTWIIDEDSRRADDVISLRGRYLAEEGKESEDFAEDLLIRPVSVFEVLVALAIRIETDIMGEPGNDHPEKWFWMFMENLGLKSITDAKFRKSPMKEHVRDSIDIFLEREYSKNGSNGGLFPLEKPHSDQRDEEIWVQMQSYLNEKYPI